MGRENVLPIELDNIKTKLVGKNIPSDQIKILVNSEKYIILHFLRHLGCMYCRNSIEQLNKVRLEFTKFPTIYFIHQSSIKQADEFFDKYYPGAAHISDPKLELYKLFGIHKINNRGFLHPLSLIKGILLRIKGFVNLTKGYGDIYILSGTFLFVNGKLIWMHKAKYAGEEPKWSGLKYLVD